MQPDETLGPTICRLNRAGISTMVPSSSDGADCTGGGAHWVCGVMMNGNSCSGVAAAEPENAMAPIASAPKAAAARREFSLNASRLSMIRPLLDRPDASFGALGGSLSDKGFRKFASKAQNDFVG